MDNEETIKAQETETFENPLFLRFPNGFRKYQMETWETPEKEPLFRLLGINPNESKTFLGEFSSKNEAKELLETLKILPKKEKKNSPKAAPRTPERKLEQLEEAENLLDDLSWRIAWALDFSEFPSIHEELDPVLTAIDYALEAIQENKTELEEALEEYKSQKEATLIEFEREYNLQNMLT